MFAPNNSPVRPRSRPTARAAVPLILSTLVVASAGWFAAQQRLSVVAELPVVAAVLAAAAGFVAVDLWRVNGRPGTALPHGLSAADIRTRRWFAAGTAMIAAVALAVLVGTLFGASGDMLGTVVSIGLLGAAAANIPAALRLGGPPTSVPTRLRDGLDGATAGICLMFTCWVLVVAPYGDPATPTFWLVLVVCAVMATAIAVALRSLSGRRAAVLCSAGVCASMVGLGCLAATLARHPVPGLVSGIGALLLVATGLVRVGLVGDNRDAYRIDGDAHPPGFDAGQRSGGDAAAPSLGVAAARAPIFVLPVVVATVVALDRVVTGGDFDRAEMLLGLIAVVLVGVRQAVVSHEQALRMDDKALRTSPSVEAAAPAAQTVAEVSAEKSIDRELSMRIKAALDPLTGLVSRRELWLAVGTNRFAPRVRGALLAIELRQVDPTGPVGDAAVRDALVVEAARRLRRVAGADDVVARLGREQFGLLTRADLVPAYGLASRVISALAQPVELPDGRSVALSVGVGMTDLSGANSADDVFRRADLALRRAHQLGRGRIEWYDPAVEQAIALRRTLELELPGALRRRELTLIYQPIMDIVRGRPHAVEALLRWRHPVLGTVMPVDVLPVAEGLGLMGEVGEWVLQQASRQLASWLREGRNLSMTINVSPHQLDASALTREVAAALATYQLPPDRLVVEVAEAGLEDGAWLDDPVGELHSLGVRTALDEFGTGAASLAHLRRLPIDMVKIGRSFFEESEAGTADRAKPLIDVMVGVGRRLGIDVVAHGVEVPAQLEVVRDAGCRLGQGHLFARPLPAEHTEAYLDGFRPRRASNALGASDLRPGSPYPRLCDRDDAAREPR